MSAISGKFKAEVIKLETATDPSKPFIRVLFKLTDEFVSFPGTDEGNFEALDNPENGFASQMYNLNKVVNPGKKMSGYDYSVDRFSKDFGVNLKLKPTLEELNERLSGSKKILILEADESTDFHKIKWINQIGPRKKEGMIDLQSLL